jgi:hypothetical protein
MRAAEHLPHTDTVTLFTVIGGKVQVNLLVAECTVSVGGAETMQLAFNPDYAGASTANLTAATTVTTVVEGDILTLTGAIGDAMNPISSATAASANNLTSGPIILPAGIITLVTNASEAGTFKWVLCYIPLEAGAYVEATYA